MGDTPDLGSGAARRVGSSPILGIFPDFQIILNEMKNQKIQEFND